jgi:hypothetical protein
MEQAVYSTPHRTHSACPGACKGHTPSAHTQSHPCMSTHIHPDRPLRCRTPLHRGAAGSPSPGGPGREGHHISGGIPPDSRYGTLLKGVFNFQPEPTALQTWVWCSI